jgi:anti-sigma B factor antagonist
VQNRAMDLRLTARVKEGVTIFDLKGKIVAGDGADLVREQAKELAAGGAPNAILNLKEVAYIDSSGLGALVMAFTALRKAGGAMKLLHLTRRNIELLVLTKLETVFEVFDDEQSAVNSFFPGREIQRFDILDFLQKHKKAGGQE